VRAVDDISFSINKGETLGIVGESGSGKSVSCLSILRLLSSNKVKIEGGEINFHENDVVVDLLSLSEKQMQSYRGAKISMIFQEPMNSLNPVMRCGNQVGEALERHTSLTKDEIKETVLDLFQKVKLPEPERIYRSYPHQLSGGQIQRVMIAMAISCKPKLIIADEPTTALDVTVQKGIISLLNDIKEATSAAIIFISHDLAVIAEIADKVAVMYKGKVVESGAIKDIFTKPQHPYTKVLLACRPPVDKKLSKLPTVEDFLDTEEQDDGTVIIKEKNTTFDFKKATLTTSQVAKHRAKIASNKIILDVQNLSKYYPKTEGLFIKSKTYTKAVDNVSFQVREGEIMGLVGESGCGKSTLARTILNIIPPTGGKVLFENENIFDLNRNRLKNLRKRLQIIFQDPYSSLNPRMSIGKAILEPMQVHNLHSNDSLRKEKVVELLELVGMNAEQFNRYPHEFSGGQRQRICIARTLSLEPKFIICDECVSALDVSVQAQVLNLLINLKNKFDLSYIFISHDLSVVKFISDTMMVMQQGKIVEKGNPDDIYNKPQQEYTRKLIDAIPKVAF
jgi:peptide/nickel transport system ATP-binding protein